MNESCPVFHWNDFCSKVNDLFVQLEELTVMSLSHTLGCRGCLRDSQDAQRHLVLMSCKKLFVHPGGMSRIITSPFTGLVHDCIYHLVLAWQRAFSPLRSKGGWNCPGFAGSSPWLPGLPFLSRLHRSAKTFSPQSGAGDMGTPRNPSGGHSSSVSCSCWEAKAESSHYFYFS